MALRSIVKAFSQAPATKSQMLAIPILPLEHSPTKPIYVYDVHGICIAILCGIEHFEQFTNQTNREATLKN